MAARDLPADTFPETMSPERAGAGRAGPLSFLREKLGAANQGGVSATELGVIQPVLIMMAMQNGSIWEIPATRLTTLHRISEARYTITRSLSSRCAAALSAGRESAIISRRFAVRLSKPTLRKVRLV